MNVTSRGYVRVWAHTMVAASAWVEGIIHTLIQFYSGHLYGQQREPPGGCYCTHRDLLVTIGRVSLARENEAGGSWGQEVHILHVNV